MPVEFWFTFNNGAESLWLPVNPSELKVSAGSANETVSVQKLGQITVIQDPVLRTYEFASHFPKHYGPYCSYVNIKPPMKGIEQLEKWKNSGYPVQFVVIHSEEEKMTLPVTIESLSYREMAGDVGSIYYELSLREFKYTKPRVIETKKENGQTVAEISNKGQRPDQSVKPKSYTVKTGDSLWAIQMRVGVPYEKIAAANGIKPPYTIYPNQVLVIP
ncbi:LysM peptidoglycan-binding domain-containing protein [Paenibacillus sp. NEAU-GSW1]|uniref:LysM peptidoglycan-binding domain-containing protein n=1 Tax=Paenibacillus sp. NEAU-GSW1 TaxID=2682486 RepID=UPI0012E2A628|nr:LysM peptidoglycan-binding domain-containing protein [Paenibacillus sp. NEAU-GSW1]MUT65318.1 LysM peptidoglycan-binding domain-containing protein [Paenibacillus sp. NEAU-GSW1]